jgi:GxxExxY protein
MFRDTAGHEELTEAIIDCGVRVHEHYGPGLLESVYKACMMIELQDAGLKIDSARRVPLVYRNVLLDHVFCPDIVINGIVVLELKAVAAVTGVHIAQVITYLKLTGLPIGLLMNFNVPLLKRGVRRIAHPELYRKS